MHVIVLDAVIGFEQTHYTISEGDGPLEVCAYLSNPPSIETLAMDIDVDVTTLSTASAGILHETVPRGDS